MITENKTIWDKWWILSMVFVLTGSAWLMALWQLDYPPIPMFFTALVAGWLFRGRPQRAARASLWVGFLWGWMAELAYFSVRLTNAAGIWAKNSGWENVGLGLAELSLYTALLCFFSSFIAWGSDKTKSVAVKDGDSHGVDKLEIPFQREATESSEPKSPTSTKNPEARDTFKP